MMNKRRIIENTPHLQVYDVDVIPERTYPLAQVGGGGGAKESDS
jgi:hypothetical protein